MVSHLITKLNWMWDHSGHYPVQYLEIIGQLMEQSDCLILIIGPDILREFNRIIIISVLDFRQAAGKCDKGADKIVKERFVFKPF